MKMRMDIGFMNPKFMISEIILKKPNSTKSTINRSISPKSTVKSTIFYFISTPITLTDSRSTLDWAMFSIIPSRDL